MGTETAPTPTVLMNHPVNTWVRLFLVPAPGRRGGSEGAGGRKRHRELRGRGSFHRRQRAVEQHGDRRAAPGQSERLPEPSVLSQGVPQGSVLGPRPFPSALKLPP